MKNEQRNIHYFDTINSADKAYFLGLLWSDGCVHSGNRLQLELKDNDSMIIEELAKKLNTTVSYRNGRARLSIRSQHLFDTLAVYGIVPRKTKKDLVVLNLGILSKHFWRGVFDGDGHVSSKYNYAQLAGNFSTITKFRLWVLEEFNVELAPPYKHKSGTWYIRLTGNRLRKVLSAMYNSPKFSMKRKRDEVLNLLKKNLVKESLRPSKEMYIYQRKDKSSNFKKYYIKIKKQFYGYFNTEKEAIEFKKELFHAI